MEGEADYLGQFLTKLVKVCKQYQIIWKSMDQWIYQLEEFDALVKKRSKSGLISKKWAKDILKNTKELSRFHYEYGKIIHSRIVFLEIEVKKYEIYGGKFAGIPFNMLEIIMKIVLEFGLLQAKFLTMWPDFYYCLTSKTDNPDFGDSLLDFTENIDFSIMRQTYFLKFEQFTKSLLRKMPRKELQRFDSIVNNCLQVFEESRESQEICI